MLDKLLSLFREPDEVRHSVLIGLKANQNYDPEHFMVRGVRNVAIVDIQYLIEHHDAIVFTLARHRFDS